MQTPEKVTASEFNGLVALYLKQCCKPKPEGKGYVCKACGAEIQQATASISLHSLRFGECGGYGDVKRVPIPYCANCEAKPKEGGCVHG